MDELGRFNSAVKVTRHVGSAYAVASRLNRGEARQPSFPCLLNLYQKGAVMRPSVFCKSIKITLLSTSDQLERFCAVLPCVTPDVTNQTYIRSYRSIPRHYETVMTPKELSMRESSRARRLDLRSSVLADGRQPSVH